MVSLAAGVGIATRYGLDGQGIESGWAARFSAPRPDWLWAPPSLLWFQYRIYFSGKKRQDRGVDHPPPSSAEVKERVELYLYSSFRLSLKVIECTSLLLPVTLLLFIRNILLSWLSLNTLSLCYSHRRTAREREISFHTHTHTHTHTQDATSVTRSTL